MIYRLVEYYEDDSIIVHEFDYENLADIRWALDYVKEHAPHHGECLDETIERVGKLTIPITDY